MKTMEVDKKSAKPLLADYDLERRAITEPTTRHLSERVGVLLDLLVD
jgi:hypothetical protein